MYDRHVTAAAIARTNQQLGWELQRYTTEQIAQAIGHFNDLYDGDAQRLRRALTPDEARFIQNERLLCALDFRDHWLPNYAWIVNWRKEPQRFRPNVAQNIVMDLWAEDEARGNAIWMQQLKARRLGVSTISELNVCHRYQFQPYSTCVVASADPDKTVEMAGMIKYALDQQPWWLLPTVTKIRRGIPVEFGDQHSTLAIEAGNQFTGVARGASPNIIHLSELCEWQDAEDIVDGALMRAVIDDPNVFGILESTALGMGNWWHRTWLQNKRDFERGVARVRPIFLPWYVGTDIYPTATDLRKRPIPANWIPQDRTIKHAERAREYVLTNPLLFKHLAKSDSSWQMPREQMWFREMEYQTAKEKKQLNIFLSEMCADDFEAFQSAGVPLIDQEILIGYQERTRQPLGVYTIVGPDIPPALVIPRRFHDASKPTITIASRELTPKYDVKYQLIPLIFTGYDQLDEQLKLLIWEWPESPYTYGVGVDCSEGVGEDNAVINVLREATPMREPGQVAEWVSNRTTAFQLWPLIHAVGCLYSSAPHPQQGRIVQCRLAIETWTNGASAQNELQKRGWHNFHPMYYAGDTRVRKRPGDVNRIGVMTNQTLRASMQDLWLTCLAEEAIDVPSPYLVQEIIALENVGGKAQAQLGAHDDRWMSLGIVHFSLEQGKPAHRQFQRKRVSYEPGLAADPAAPHPTWTPGLQSSSTPFGPNRRVEQRLFRLRGKGSLDRYVNPDLPIRYR